MSKEQQSVDALIAALQALRLDLKENPTSWQNTSLADYLDGIHAWLEDSRATLPDQPSWDFVAGLFKVGKIYE